MIKKVSVYLNGGMLAFLPPERVAAGSNLGTVSVFTGEKEIIVFLELECTCSVM